MDTLTPKMTKALESHRGRKVRLYDPEDVKVRFPLFMLGLKLMQPNACRPLLETGMVEDPMVQTAMLLHLVADIMRTILPRRREISTMGCLRTMRMRTVSYNFDL